LRISQRAKRGHVRKGTGKESKTKTRNILERIIIHHNIVDDYQYIESVTKPDQGGRRFLDTWVKIKEKHAY
jgi:hypothetical protein